MASTLRSFVVAVDRISSRLLGREGSVRNARAQLDERRRSYEQIEVLRRRLVAVERRVVGRAA